MAKNNWTKEEHILAFNLYCKTPFAKINSSNKAIQDLAPIIGRSMGSVAMKLANFARLDPALQARNISGLSQGAKGEEEVWKEFNGNWEELAWLSEKILAKYKGKSIEKSTEIIIDDLPSEGKERETLIKSRVNQSFFRKTILASYDYSCCITGISVPNLLVASHIIPWSINHKNRVNPSNGLCLNSLHDKSFDIGLITITPNYRLKLSKIILESKDEAKNNFFLPYKDEVIRLPKRFLPGNEFLEWHNENVFKG